MLATPVLLLALLTPADDFAQHFERRDLGELMQLWHDESPTRVADRRRLTLLALDGARVAERENRLEVRDTNGTLLEQYELATRDDRVWSLTPLAPQTTIAAAREQLHRGADLADSGDLAGAEAAFTRAVELAGTASHAPTRSSAERGLGVVAFTRGNMSASVGHLETALATARAAGDRLNEGRALERLAFGDRASGNAQRAEERFREALAIFREVGHPLLAAHALTGLGIVMNTKSAFDEGHKILAEAVAAFEALGDADGLAIALNAHGVNLRHRGLYGESAAALRRSIDLARSVGNQTGVANAQGNLGIVLVSLGHYAEALPAYRESLAILERIGRVPSIVIALNNLGEMYRTLGDPEQAAELTLRALAMSEKAGILPGIGLALHNLAQIHLDQDEVRAAIDLYERSAAVELMTGDQLDYARTLHNIGRAHVRANDYATARPFFQKVLAIARELNHRESIMLALGALGEVSETPKQGIEHVREMKAIAETLASPELRMFAHAGLGRMLRRAGDLDSARIELEQSVALAEELRRGVPGLEIDAQQAFTKLVMPHQELATVLIEQGDVARALEYAERGKARALLDVLRHGRPDIAGALTEAERAQEAALVALLGEVNRQHRRALISGKVSPELQARVRKARLDYEQFVDDVFAAHPQLRMERGDVRPARLSDTSALLASGVADAFVEFLVADERSYVFVVTTDGGIRAHTIAIGQHALQREVLKFRELLASHDLTYAAVARSLYDRLLAPAAAQLRGKRTVCIVPDGPLWELPFQTLQPSATEFLLDRHAIYYAPSLTVLREMSRAAAPRGRDARLIAFGNPLMPIETPGRATRTRRDASLAPLPHTETEIRNIASLYGARNSRIHVRSDAREEVVKAEAGRFDVLHFATHGVLDDQNALYSRLVFSPPRAAGEDGLLEAREIMRLDLNARLAVLSACETARGRVGRGEGLIGLSWALFLAGVPTSVVSQWSVDSESTAALMFEFHRQLRTSGRNAAEALRLAALATRAKREYRHPFYWAPFVVVGNGR